MKIDKTMKRWVFSLIAALAIFLTADLCAPTYGAASTKAARLSSRR